MKRKVLIYNWDGLKILDDSTLETKFNSEKFISDKLQINKQQIKVTTDSVVIILDKKQDYNAIQKRLSGFLERV
ncbi:MAG: hypothetical protein ACK40G_12125 [Cytophagaceae bacterium]